MDYFRSCYSGWEIECSQSATWCCWIRAVINPIWEVEVDDRAATPLNDPWSMSWPVESQPSTHQSSRVANSLVSRCGGQRPNLKQPLISCAVRSTTPPNSTTEHRCVTTRCERSVYNLRSKRDWSFMIITNPRNQLALKTAFAPTASSETENVLWENAVIAINQMPFGAKTSRIGAVASLPRGWACKRLLVSGAVVVECVTGFPRYAWVPKYNLGQKTSLLRWADYCKLCKCTVRGISTDCCWYIVFGTLLGIYACADRLICRVC